MNGTATASGSSASVDTGKVAGRRTLHFKTLDEALADADQLANLEREGRLQHIGNWTLGQVFGHLAAWAEYAYTGSPKKPPLIIKLILKFMKKRFIWAPMKAGVHIPGAPNGTYGTDIIPTDQGLSRYHAALDRLGREAPTRPNDVFGRLTHEEWINMQLRHAELHLSFFRPQ